MEIKDLEKRPNIEQDKKLMKKYAYFEKLITELNKKEIPTEIANTINEDIDVVNSFSGSNKDLLKLLRKTPLKILTLLEKELKLVPKNHYRNRWIAIGMAAFGIPLGAAMGASLGNMAFLGAGLPIGIAIGAGVGTAMDSKARDSGKQLDLESEH